MPENKFPYISKTEKLFGIPDSNALILHIPLKSDEYQLILAYSRLTHDFAILFYDTDKTATGFDGETLFRWKL